MSSLPLTLLGIGDPGITADWRPARIELDPCCWIDHCSGFLEGADTLFGSLEESMAWQRGRRLMYGTWYDEPRLTSDQPVESSAVPPMIKSIRRALTAFYRGAFEGLFCNLYETGSDSVAWHADRIGRTEIDPLVAIISLGGPRTLAFRPQQGGPGLRVPLHSGDLLVMGGAMQHHWEHAVPKVVRASPRMSVTMRTGGSALAGGVEGR